MDLTILIKYCGFIAYSKPNNVTLSAFRGKISGTIIYPAKEQSDCKQTFCVTPRMHVATAKRKSADDATFAGATCRLLFRNSWKMEKFVGKKKELLLTIHFTNQMC